MATLTIDLPTAPRAPVAYRLAADCPRCGAPLVLRQNRQTGEPFTGCSACIAAMGGKHGGKWRAIPNFVDTGFYQFNSRAADDAPLVFLGRVEPIKGAHIAIAIAKQAGRRLVIAGNHGESLLRPAR